MTPEQLRQRRRARSGQVLNKRTLDALAKFSRIAESSGIFAPWPQSIVNTDEYKAAQKARNDEAYQLLNRVKVAPLERPTIWQRVKRFFKRG